MDQAYTIPIIPDYGPYHSCTVERGTHHTTLLSPCFKADTGNRMQTCGRKALTNYRGGFLGVLIYLAISALVFFAGFMAAFGNDTPAARLVLSIFEIYFIVAFPLWAIPLSYFAGCCLFCPGEQKPDTTQ